MNRGTYVFQRKGRRGWTLEWIEGGQVRQRQFPTKREAQEAADDARARERASRGLGTDEPLREYARAWLARVSPHLREGTRRHYATALDRHVLPALGEVTLQGLRRAHVRDLVAGLVRGGLSRKSASNIRGVLHAVLSEAREDGIIAVNPATGLGRTRAARLAPTRGERAARVRALTGVQLGALLDATERVLAFDRALLVRVVALTGMRLGEVTGLKWEDLDLRARTVLVRRGITEGRVEGTKTGAERTVDLAVHVAARLTRLDSATKADALAAGRERWPWVFASTKGTPRHPMYVRADLTRALRAAGLPTHFTPHALRHTYASLMLARGESLVYVQRQLGHATVNMTADLYGRWLPVGNVACADRLERVVCGPASGDCQEDSAGIGNIGMPRTL